MAIQEHDIAFQNKAKHKGQKSNEWAKKILKKEIVFRKDWINTISIYTIVQFIWTSTFQKLTFINIHGLSCVYSIGLLYN